MDNVTYNANEVINGLYGFLNDEDGKLLQETEEFELSAEFEKKAMKVPGKFYEAHRVTGGSLKGKIKMKKKDSRLQKKIATNPTAKFNYLGQLKDPDAKGNEAVLIKGLSFDGNDIIKWTLGDLTEVELDFTADDYEYVESID